MLSKPVQAVTRHSRFAAAFASKPQKMSNSEAFVETMVSHKVDTGFGIVGSAFMDALDLFPAAGIRFVSVQHEQNAVHMADGYARASGRTGMCISQNGPGITNFVTGMGAALGAHTPLVAITPEAGTATKGHGGFQEVDQMPIFGPVSKAQFHVNNPNRMVEFTHLAFETAARDRGPVQLNIPRDYFYGHGDYAIPDPTNVAHTRVAGNAILLKEAAELLKNAKKPVILSGGGVVMGDAVAECVALAEKLGAPVACSYLHNDSFPSDHPQWCGSLGYQGSKAAMALFAEADVILALGSRLGPFGTLPQYGIDYWPKNAKIIQVELDPARVGRVKPADVGIAGDAKLAAQEILKHLESAPARSVRPEIAEQKAAWEKQLDEQTLQGEPNGGGSDEHQMIPRTALRELEKALPADAMVSTDIGNICSVSNSYLRFTKTPSMFAAMTFGNCGYALPTIMGAKVACPERPAVSYAGDGAWGMSLNEVLTCVREDIPVTAVVFNNRQWGAEKKNQVLWFGDRYVGTNFANPSVGFAGIAKAMGAEGIQVSKPEEVGPALKKAIDAQMKEGKTTVVEIMVNRELGEPFRRDAMKLPKRLLDKYQGTTEMAESATQQPVDVKQTRK